ALLGKLVMKETGFDEEGVCGEGSEDDTDDENCGGGKPTFEEEVYDMVRRGIMEERESCVVMEERESCVYDIVRRGIMEEVKIDNICMEVNGRKFAHDRSFGDCAAILVPAMFGTLPVTKSRKVAFEGANKLIEAWTPLIKKFARSVADQKQTIEEWKALKLMAPILKSMYDADLLEDTAIINWAGEAEDRDAQGVALAAECKALVEYLEEEDEDDDEDDDDE
ncbi:hypothetical protein T484DRAFT_1828130, partial [Baffinella frigidus]